MTTYTHVAEEYRHVLGQSDRQRLDFLDQEILLDYPAATELHKRLKRLLELPKRTRMGNLLIVGESNNGKSTIVEQFQREHGRPYVNDDNEPVKPVIIAQAPPTADEKSLHLSILKQFHAPHRVTAPATELRYQVIHLLRLCHTRMLIIDELHSVLTGTSRKQSEVMNTIKLLCNELQIPIVGVGTREAVNVLQTDPQHASRFPVELLPLWEPNGEFQRLLVGFEETLPLRQASDLWRKEMMEPLHDISSGNLGDLRELLTECARKAIETGKERIDAEIVKSMTWFKPTKGGIRGRNLRTADGRFP